MLFDAVAVVVTQEGAERLATVPEARDFVTDAVAHKKFIAHNAAAGPIFDAAGLSPGDIEGVSAVSGASSVEAFAKMLPELRAWDRADG